MCERGGRGCLCLCVRRGRREGGSVEEKFVWERKVFVYMYVEAEREKCVFYLRIHVCVCKDEGRLCLRCMYVSFLRVCVGSKYLQKELQDERYFPNTATES